MSRPLVVIGLLGPSLDGGDGPKRWEYWRPSVALCQHDDLLVSRFDLLYEAKFKKRADVIESDIASVSPQTRLVRHEVEFKDAWDFETVFESLLSFSRDYTFDTDREDYLVHITTGTHVAQICLFLLTESRHLPGKLLQTSPPRKSGGGSGYFSIIDLDLERYGRIAARFEKERTDAQSILKSGIATRNAAFNKMIEHIERVAGASPAPILLAGPTGAGKSQLAARIYDLLKSRRQISGAFVELNCATLRGDSAMSTLFGHAKGAFTGAVTDRAGHLRAADKGVLFLDEIGELGQDEQAMLLRALETGRFFPMGSDREVDSRFQLIAGTNRDLGERVRMGLFREDLLARIDLWTFALPALKDRKEDLEPNIDYELEQFSRRTGRHVSFSREAREAFVTFAQSPESSWARNFRDLAGAITRMATEAPGGRITTAGVRTEVQRLTAAWSAAAPKASWGEDTLLRHLSKKTVLELDPFDRVQLAYVLDVVETNPSLAEAGRQLFSVSRESKTSSNDADRVRKYLARFHLTLKDVKNNLHVARRGTTAGQ